MKLGVSGQRGYVSQSASKRCLITAIRIDSFLIKAEPRGTTIGATAVQAILAGTAVELK